MYAVQARASVRNDSKFLHLLSSLASEVLGRVRGDF